MREASTACSVEALKAEALKVEAYLAGPCSVEACSLEALRAEAYLVGPCWVEACLAEAYSVEAYCVEAYVVEACWAEAYSVEAYSVEACWAEACLAEACLVEAYWVEACWVAVFAQVAAFAPALHQSERWCLSRAGCVEQREQRRPGTRKRSRIRPIQTTAWGRRVTPMGVASHRRANPLTPQMVSSIAHRQRREMMLLAWGVA